MAVKPNWRKVQRAALKEHGYWCWYCGVPLSKLHYGHRDLTEGENGWTVDHQKPRSKGGASHVDNCVPSCSRCNFSKNDKTLEEYRFYLTKRNSDYFKAAIHLQKALDVADLPFEKAISKAVKWLKEESETHVFCGEIL